MTERIYYLATDAPLAKMEKCVKRISDLVTLQRAYDDLTHRVRLAQVKWEQGKLTFEERESLMAEVAELAELRMMLTKAGG